MVIPVIPRNDSTSYRIQKKKILQKAALYVSK